MYEEDVLVLRKRKHMPACWGSGAMAFATGSQVFQGKLYKATGV